VLGGKNSKLMGVVRGIKIQCLRVMGKRK
jgi:hypothetical protein